MKILSLNVDSLNRQQIRSKILQTWDAETSGSGEYRYNVEKCKDGSSIYLLRPARLNKGCDFAIVSENFLKFKNGNDKPPKHEDVFELIRSLLRPDPSLKVAFIAAAQRIYDSENIDEVLSAYPTLSAVSGCGVERALKLLKWMWIEQDITYWTKTGRQMLKDALDDFVQTL